MCGRYALALRPGQVRQMLEQDNMPVYDAPPDPEDDDDDGGDGYGARGGGDNDVAPPPPRPRQSYNFAPGYHGIVYRADVPDWGAGPRRSRSHGQRQGTGAAASGEAEHASDGERDDGDADEGGGGGGGREKAEKSEEVRYKLQAMKWGLIPFWTKRNPDYGAMMKTINCRDDSLAAQSGGGSMWASMKARKRCVVVAQGFYEWLKKGSGKGGEKVPHFVRRRDGKLMCFAGLWDVVQYEKDEGHQRKNYTYTIITTDSNKQLSFLHDRMPVILENGSEALRTWLDPKRHEWSKELQSLLKPFEGELDVYPVSKEVGKVGNNSPSFVIPVDSKENKNNIANFFAKGAAATAKKSGGAGNEDGTLPSSRVKEELKEETMQKHQQPEVEVTKEEGFTTEDETKAEKVGGEEPSTVSQSMKAVSTRATGTGGVKREAEDNDDVAEEVPPTKKKKENTTATTSPAKSSSSRSSKPKISATSNGTKSPRKPKEPGTQKITNFFANSS
ncbi:hypothetical protein SLS62_004045 [Diatrype stigma]|uniref:Embryonic stem cell-specific 5-hydroxymethylcytosine-binding protein n=1 Tax=Diatrype stigma TaxID=117547 RepID=A0AAN9YTG1_9PEZI